MTPGIPHAARVRAYLAGVVVTAGLSGIAWRAWAVQVTDSDHYRALAAKQHALTVGIPAPRGDIIDAHGRPLAVTAAADSIWANPREIHDVTDTADKLAKLLGDDANLLEAKLAGDRRFVWIDRHVTPELARRVESAKLPGIEVGKEPRRWYPARAIGGTVVGRSDIDGKGLDGIELAMDAQLVGHRGAGRALRDARGKKMFANGFDRPEAGATVQLSLDTSIQASAEAALGEAVRVNKAKSGVAVVVEIATGRVLAMASSPSYDPNAPNPADGRPGPRNRAVTDAFEAGSVMKIFSVAAALDDGTINPDTGFDLGGGQFRVGVKTIRDVHHDPYLSVAGIIKRSSNVGTAKIALRFGAEKLYAALRRFGFGQRTGIELPGEQPGMLRNGARWRDIELATISYGYGLAVTPLQIAAALAAFGDHGVYREPRIVDRVTDADGTLLYQAAPAMRQVVSDRTARAMLAMLASTFEGGKQAGTAAMIVVPGFRCGGKTGTARKYDPATRQYASDRYLSTFAGIAPIDHPRLAIVVLIDDPSGGDYYGGKVAGPVFATIASEALRYLGVPGESPICAPPTPGAPASTAPKICVPAARVAPASPSPGMAAPESAARSARDAAADASPEVTSEATSDATSDATNEATCDATSEATCDATNEATLPASGAPAGTEIEIPDFRGLGMARALALARKAHLTVEVSGTGRVIQQEPAPGAFRQRAPRQPSVATTGLVLPESRHASPRVALKFSDADLSRPRPPAGSP
jgi:cell division protein FtsI (penicillin-binding protein 3)